ncbi:hypothetical protein Tco_0678278 [Tanacetum coccineum]|uniref:Uncharacterized protein n=1 Tax=Tanacetum coccineum TaxID=301880 RepID=A0ABQ4XEL0_9ASTR
MGLASYTGCEAGFFPFTYLGLPIGSNGSSEDFKKLAWVKWWNILASLNFGIANGSWFWDWSRPVNVGRTKAEFDALISDIASLKPKSSLILILAFGVFLTTTNF